MHHISKSCGGEKCKLCQSAATHKIGEEILSDDPQKIRHNLTAYVCCNCFQHIFGNKKRNDCDIVYGSEMYE